MASERPDQVAQQSPPADAVFGPELGRLSQHAEELVRMLNGKIAEIRLRRTHGDLSEDDGRLLIFLQQFEETAFEALSDWLANLKIHETGGAPVLEEDDP